MMTDPRSVAPSDMSFDQLRVERSLARRQLELASMRLHAHDRATDAVLEPLRERARVLTDELIDRYARDLSLVDQLLESPYPANGRGSLRRASSAPEVTT